MQQDKPLVAGQAGHDTRVTAQRALRRKAFIEECRNKAWGAACHADWISKQMDELIAHYKKLQVEDAELQANIKESETAIDYHTVDSREKRRGWQERRNQIAQEMKLIAENAQQGQQAMNNLLQSAESALQLAAHAEKWEWLETKA